jgi:hypothetical protein
MADNRGRKGPYSAANSSLEGDLAARLQNWAIPGASEEWAHQYLASGVYPRLDCQWHAERRLTCTQIGTPGRGPIPDLAQGAMLLTISDKDSADTTAKTQVGNGYEPQHYPYRDWPLAIHPACLGHPG